MSVVFNKSRDEFVDRIRRSYAFLDFVPLKHGMSY